MSATELLAGAVETRTVVNAEKIAAAFSANGWESKVVGSVSLTTYRRGGETVHTYTHNGATVIAREVGGTLTKLARLIGPRKERKPREAKKKK